MPAAQVPAAVLLRRQLELQFQQLAQQLELQQLFELGERLGVVEQQQRVELLFLQQQLQLPQRLKPGLHLRRARRV